MIATNSPKAVYDLVHTEDEDSHSIISEGSEPVTGVHSSALSSSVSSSSSIEGITFELDYRIRRPFDFFFPERNQKDDVREMIAEKYGCRVDPDPTGRTMTFFGLEMENVEACIQDMARTQAYYLRPRYRLKQICLVESTCPDQFRIVLVPLARHDHYSKLITFVPTRYPVPSDRIQLRAFYKAVCARKSLMTRKWTVTPSVRPLPGIQDLLYPNQISQNQSPSSTPVSFTSSSNTTRSHATVKRQANFSGHEGTGTQSSSGDLEEAFPPIAVATATKLPSKRQPRLMSSVVRPDGGGGVTRPIPERPWPAKAPDSFGETEFPALGTSSTIKNANAEPDHTSAVPDTPTTAASPVATSPSTASSAVTESPSAAGTTLPTTSLTTPPTTSSEEPQLICFDDDDLDFLTNKSNTAGNSNNERRTNFRQPSLLDDDLLSKPSLLSKSFESLELERDIRELPLQRAPPSNLSWPSSSSTSATNLYNYNLGRTLDVFKGALEELQGRRKEIRVIGRLGHILYSNVPATGSHTLWKYTDLDALVFGNLGVRHIFSPAALTTQEQFERLHRSMDDKPIVCSYFEVQCRSRSNPSSPYTPTIIKVPSDKAVLEWVVTPWESFGSVKLDSLDMEFGMELRIEAREGVSKSKDSARGRVDVKPYNQFRKKISIGPESRSITCSGVERYLEIDGIQFKVEYMYHLPSTDGGQFTLKVVRVEDIVLERPSPILCTGTTRSHGRTWFELEIEHQGIARILEENLTLKPRMLADWTVEDILGSIHPESANVVKEFLYQFQYVAGRCRRT
ncbi:hypothetical protein BGW41_006215 [Actinomortierella wolfii]|nr:hypothetical protein BGW41_006215 [Actinomortierella wolfii]